MTSLPGMTCRKHYSAVLIMEKNKEEQKKPHPDETRTEEVQTIIDRMPTVGARYAALVTCVLVGVTLLMGFVIKYPDTVDGPISITALYAPVRIVSHTGGRLHLIKENNKPVEKEEVIAYLHNAADYNAVQTLTGLLRDSEEKDGIVSFPSGIELGELSTAYNNFVLAYNQYYRFEEKNTYPAQYASLKKQISMDSLILHNTETELALKEEMLGIVAERAYRDSVMFASDAISELEWMNRRKEELSVREAYQNLQTNRSSILSRIHTNSREVDRLEIEEEENREKLNIQMLASRNELSNAIRQWQHTYVVTTPVDGRLEYLGFWRENSFVNAGTELYSVIPDKNELIGEVIISSQGAGKVKPGLTVNVKLNNYPYDEYGSIKGEVLSVSELTNKMKSGEGEVDTYLVTIGFPHGATTNYGIELGLNIETKGVAEIITKDKQLIHRLFDNLKYAVTK